MNIPFLTTAELCSYLNITPEVLHEYIQHPKKYYRTFYINKDTGEVVPYNAALRLRTICAPAKPLAAVLRNLATWLATFPKHEANYAFMVHKNTFAAAKEMANNDLLIRVDLKDFFPAHKGLFIYKKLLGLVLASDEHTPAEVRQVRNVLIPVCRLLAPFGSLLQGAPTSPVLSVILNYGLDMRMVTLSHSVGLKYIRYADDLFFGGTLPTDRIPTFIESVKYCVHPFRVNEKKVDIMHISSKYDLVGFYLRTTGLEAQAETSLREQGLNYAKRTTPSFTLFKVRMRKQPEADINAAMTRMSEYGVVKPMKFYKQSIQRMLGLFLVPEIKYPKKKYHMLRKEAMYLGIYLAAEYRKEHHLPVDMEVPEVNPKSVRGNISYIKAVDPKKAAALEAIIDKYFNKYKEATINE